MSPSVDLHHVVDGPTGAPAVVLAHAIGTSLAMWDPQLPALAAFRVVRVDLRGHGRSPVPDGPYAMSDFGADLLRLFGRLGIERASICGLSLGGIVGLWLAAHAPERVDRLVACCVQAHPSRPGIWTERAALIRAGGMAAVSDMVIERWGYRDRAPAVEGLVRGMLAETPAEGYAATCDAIATLDLRPDLARIRAPTLLLAGDHDPASPPSLAGEIAASIPGARVTVIRGAAHLANVEQPAAVTSAILEHLRESAT